MMRHGCDRMTAVARVGVTPATGGGKPGLEPGAAAVSGPGTDGPFEHRRPAAAPARARSGRGRTVALIGAGALLAALGTGAGWWVARREVPAAAAATPAAPAVERRVLYWYDPMVPNQHFEQPGKSPFMDMALVPKYADEAGAGEGSVQIDPRLRQNLGMRSAVVEEGTLAGGGQRLPAVLGYNGRAAAVVQARAAGFVERVYGHAPLDVLAPGAPLVDLLLPEWAAAQREYLAVRATGDAHLARAARERLRLLGMPEDSIARIERSGEPETVVTVAAPIGGVLTELGVRAGMRVDAGATLARIDGIDPVWLTAAVAEAQAAGLSPGATVAARLAAFPGEIFGGRVTALLPEVHAETRTLRLRVELANTDGRLRPGMYATLDITPEGGRRALLVPSEALIRTGRRTLVLLAESAGAFRPVEVVAGREADGKTEVLEGLAAGQRVVVSGQFLIDSEASLRASGERMAGDAPAADQAAAAPLYAAEGRVEAFGDDEITLSHGPVPALGWGAMTMPFKLGGQASAAKPALGARVRIAFRQGADGFVIERLEELSR